MNEDIYKKRVSEPNREKLIDGIINKYLDKYRGRNDGKQKLAIFIGGGSGSGKSTLRKRLIDSGNLPNCLVIDSDNLKRLIPEYTAMAKDLPEMAASIVHEESSRMASKMFEEALKEKISFIFDATMKNTDKYKDFFSRLRVNGFQIELIITTVSVKTASDRNKQRFQKLLDQKKPTRLVPEETVKESHEKIVKSFKALKGSVDNWEIINNEGASTVVATKEKIFDEQLYQKFMEDNN